MSKNVSGLIEFVKSKIGTPYVYGAKGAVLSRTQIQVLQNQYGKTCVWDSDLNKAGKVAVDCSGLISWYTGIIRGSSAYKSTSTQITPISQRSTTHIGWAVWMQGHIGIYLGDNQYIAADGSLYGVRIANLSQNGFTHLLKLCDIEYDTNAISLLANQLGDSEISKGTFIDWLKDKNIDSSKANRGKLAAQNGINGYLGTAAQNIKLWNILKGTSSQSTNRSTGEYRLLVSLNVRTGPGTNYAKKSKNQLSTDGQNNSNSIGTLNVGTIVTVMETKIVEDNVWARTPSGWIAAVYGGEVYITKL